MGFCRSNDQLAGTGLPRVSDETMQRVLMSDPLADWWHGDTPLKG